MGSDREAQIRGGGGSKSAVTPASDTANPKDVSELKERYGEGKLTWGICPNCDKKFQCCSKEVFVGAHGMFVSLL